MRDTTASTLDSEPPGDPVDLAALVDLCADRPVTVLTGAGCSTESGIPDYRGPRSANRRPPIQYREFVTSEAGRRRYWARSMVGWSRVDAARPNPGHRAIARLEHRGLATGVITQNVDGLHGRAGSGRVVELHGSLSRVRCLACAAIESRIEFQARLAALNPDFDAARATAAPDGDADVEAETYREFAVPPCRVCAGVVKPDVVFFGENVPRSRVERAWQLWREGEVLLVVGSSLTVFSGYRFVLRAAREGRPVAIVNLGETRGDAHAVVKVDATVGTVLPALMRGLQRRRSGSAHPRSHV